MIRLLVLSLAIAIFAVPYAFAGKSSGCGLGSELFKGQSGLVMNVLAATTNGSSGNQTFGMTSGTSGCAGSDTVLNDANQEEFVAVNFENISTEMAKGEGQYVNALAQMMGCSAAVQGDFARVSKEKFEVLFQSPDMEAKAWLGGLKTELAKEPVLAGGCTRLT